MLALNTLANVDVLAILSIETEISALYPILVQSVLNYLELFEDSLKKLNVTPQEVSFETFHFLPVDLPHFVTVLFLKNESEEALSKYEFVA